MLKLVLLQKVKGDVIDLGCYNGTSTLFLDKTGRTGESFFITDTSFIEFNFSNNANRF